MELYVIGWASAVGLWKDDLAREPHWIKIGGPYGNMRQAIAVGDATMNHPQAAPAPEGYILLSYVVVKNYEMALYGFQVYGEIRQPLPGIDKVGP